MRRLGRLAGGSIWIARAAVALGFLLALPFVAAPLEAEQQAWVAVGGLLVFTICALVPGRGTLVFLALLSGIISTRYIYWRVTDTLDYTGFWATFLGTGLLLAEIYAVIALLLSYLQSLWPLERRPVPLPDDPAEWPKVDVFIPIYNEPLDVVKPTVFAAMAMDWPRDKMNVVLLDDGRREEFRAFCEQVGCGYMVRPDNKGAKAGNINHALSRTDGEYVLVFDCDHVATRAFLQMTVGWLVRDAGLAMVQTPHHFYSPDPVAPDGGAAVRPAGRRTMLAGEGQGSSFEPLDANPAGAAAGGLTPSQLRASDDPLLAEIGRQLAEVNEQASGRLVPSFAFRARSGSGGLERLREYGGGAEAAMPLPGLGGELSARMQAVSLDAGGLDTSLSSLRRFGTNPVELRGSPTEAQAAALRPRDQSATGTAIGAAYARSGVTVDLGSTPLGFQEQRLLGGIEVTPRLSENLQFRLRGERRSVTDSLLSWSGMRDGATGTAFGGVTRSTGRAQLEYFSDRVSAYAGGGYSSITGRNVAENNRVEASAGLGYAVLRSPTRELTTGLDLSYFAYDRNLRNFTYGQGGYFSPQTYINASVPLDYRERIGDFAYHLGASLGIANFREKSSPVFPTDRGLQSALEQQAAADSSIGTRYGSQRSTTLTAGLRADVEYALTPVLRIGATARYDRAADFNETRALVYARYRFDP